MVRTFELGIQTKAKALKVKRKAVGEGFKGVKIKPNTSYGSKSPYSYDVEYTSVNPIINKTKKYKDKIVKTQYRQTPKGLKRISSETRSR